MRWIILLPVWLCAAVCPSMAGERAVRGIVKDAATDSCLSFVNVMAYTLPDSVLLGFAVSDDAGRFSLDAPAGGRLLLKATCLGYQAAEIEVSSVDDSVCISMKPDVMVLRNIVVKGRMPGFKVRGDTIDYNFRKYTDGSEKVLKDILAKLPGMDVDSKGQVTANGEAVKKILVNGQDFFGDHNEQITNNLPSDYVDKIQLRKNYSEYSLVEGFKTHKATALNVAIDSLHSGNVTGNAELLGGYRDKYRGAANLFSFGDKVMWGINAKVFNTGEEMMTLMDYIKLLGGVKDYAQVLGGAGRIIDNGLSAVSYIDNSIDTYRRTNGVASANVAWNPSEHVKLNAYYLFNLERSKGQYDITRSYWGREAVETMGQVTDRERGFHHAGFSMKSMLPGNAALDWRLVMTAMPQNSRNRLGAYAWDEDTDVWNLSHSLSFAKNWNNRNLLSVSSQLLYNHAHRTMDVASADSLLYMPELQLHAISQDQRTAMLDHHLAVSWVHRLSKVWQLKMNTTWNLIRSTMSVSPSVLQPAAQEDEDVTRLYGYGLSLQKKKGLFRFDAGFDLAYLDPIHSTDKIALLPNASIELALSSVNALSLSYSSGYERDDSYFARATILDDYRQMTVYDGKEDLLHKSHNVTLNAHYFNILSDFTWIMNVGCSFTEHPYIPNYDSNGHTTIASWMETDRSHVSQHAYFNIKKGFRFPLVLALKSTLVNTRYQTAYHRQVSRNRFSRAEGELSLTSRFKSSWINMEVGYRFNFRQSKVGISDTRLSLMSYEAYARPFLVRKGRLDVSMPLTFIHDRSGERRYNYFDAGVQASYTAGRWSFSVEGKNLLHTRRFERISVAAENDYMETIVERRLPGYVVIGLKRMF